MEEILSNERESDVDTDEALANARETGGGDADEGDAEATTGTGENEEFVGRVAGQDEGYAGETGAEARSQPPGG
ncbi:MAG: hypothetical protein H0T66_06860 [Geodermatophilaceae bacterium]|nr:hypothetical protein [Geodermatophilaceae bacterium]